MGLNFRKSIKLADGVKLNVGKKSASVSVGKKGAHVNVSSTGRKSITVGIPGTGLSYTQEIGKKSTAKKKSSSSSKSGSKSKSSKKDAD